MLRFRTTHWQRVRARDSIGDPAFARHLRELERPRQIAFQRLMFAYQGEPIGIECKSRTRQAWAFVLPEVSSDEYPFRVQYFDEDGFSGHHCYNSLVTAVETMLSEGYQTVDAGALDRCAATDRWILGTQRENVRLKYNLGLITFQRMLEEMAAVTV